MGQWNRGRGQAGRRIRVMLLLGMLAVAGFQSAHAAWRKPKVQEKPLANSVAAVAVQDQAANTEIRITTTTPATYSVYLMLDPLRLMVDILDAGLAAEVPAALPVGNGLVNQIKSSRITADGGALARIEIGLDRKVEYEVDKQDRLLLIRLSKAENPPAPAPNPQGEVFKEGGGKVYVESSGSEPPAPAPAGEAAPATESPLEWEAETAPAAATSAPGAPAPVAQPTLAAPSGPAKKLLDLGVDSQSDRTVITVVTDGLVGNYNAFALDNPSRLVVDLWKLGNLYPNTQLAVNSQGLKDIRLGQHPDKVRLVFDASGKNFPSYRFDKSGERLIVTVSSTLDLATAAPSAPAPLESVAPATAAAPAGDEAAGWEEAPAGGMAPGAPAPGVPAETEGQAAEKAPAAGSRILSIDFKWDPAASSVVVKTDKPVKFDRVENAQDRIVTLLVHDAYLPKELERSLDTSEFQSPVNLVSSFQSTTTPPEVNVSISLNTMVASSVQQKGDALTLRLENAPGGLPPGEAVSPFAGGTEQAPAATAAGPEKLAAAPKAAAAAGGGEEYAGAPIYLDAKGMDVIDAFRLIAEVSGLNIITADNVKGRITLKLDNVPWDQALDIILETKNLGMVKKGNIIRIAPMEQIAAERASDIKRREDQEKLKPLVTRIVPVNYGVATDLVARLKAVLSPRGKAEFDKRTNAIIIRDIPEKLDEAQAMIAALDSPTPQVLIEARVVEASVGITRQIGVQWGVGYGAGTAFGTPTGLVFPSSINLGGAVLGGVPAGTGASSAPNLSSGGGAMGLSLGSLTGVGDLDLVLQALETQNKLKVISSPRVMTVNNNKATIEQGVTIPYPPAASLGGAASSWTFVEASLRLEVTPRVSADKSIVLEVKVSNNQPDLKVVSGGAPSIDKKEAQTEILIHDGDTAVIGGIYKISKSETINVVPFLGRLPFIGYLFKTRLASNSNDELLVFLTPRIIEAGGPSTTHGI